MEKNMIFGAGLGQLELGISCTFFITIVFYKLYCLIVCCLVPLEPSTFSKKLFQNNWLIQDCTINLLDRNLIWLFIFLCARERNLCTPGDWNGLATLTTLLIMGSLIFINTLSGISLIKTQELLMVIHLFIVLQNKEILMYANSF